MSSLSTALPILGGLGAGLAWSHRSRGRSVAVRLLSERRPNAATRSGIAVDLGPPSGEWSRPALAASLDHSLSDVVGRPFESAAYSRFGDFEGLRAYSRFLDPESEYYQAWLGAYVVLDGPGGAFGFDPDGAARTEEALAVLEADQRLVYRSSGCPRRFGDGSCTRVVGEVHVSGPDADGWWRLRGEADTWSSYCRGGGEANVWGRALYGVVPADSDHGVEDYHPLRYSGEFWIRHDALIGATCCSFLIAPLFEDSGGRERFPGEALLSEAGERLPLVRFYRG